MTVTFLQDPPLKVLEIKLHHDNGAPVQTQS